MPKSELMLHAMTLLAHVLHAGAGIIGLTSGTMVRVRFTGYTPTTRVQGATGRSM